MLLKSFIYTKEILEYSREDSMSALLEVKKNVCFIRVVLI